MPRGAGERAGAHHAPPTRTLPLALAPNTSTHPARLTPRADLRSGAQRARLRADGGQRGLVTASGRRELTITSPSYCSWRTGRLNVKLRMRFDSLPYLPECEGTSVTPKAPKKRCEVTSCSKAVLASLCADGFTVKGTPTGEFRQRIGSRAQRVWASRTSRDPIFV